MSVKLTTVMREAIVKDILRHRFADEAAKLIAERAALAAAVYNDIYSADVRRKMDALPDGWLRTNSEISVQFGANYEGLAFNGRLHWGDAIYDIPERVYRRIPERDHHRCLKVYEATHPLCEEFERLRSIGTDLRTAVTAAEGAALRVVRSVTTTGKLIEVWPEITPFVERQHSAPRRVVPAIPLESLNATLRLPVAMAAE